MTSTRAKRKNHTPTILWLILCLIVTSCDYFKKPDSCASIFENSPDLLSGFSLRSGGLANHDNTPLDWARCPAGMLFKSSQSCAGQPLLLDFKQAQLYAGELAEKSGQKIRLPTGKEMDSVKERSCINPALNLNVFPEAITDNYWTSEENSNRSRLGCVFYTYQGRRSCLEPKELEHPFMLVVDRSPSIP
jgi:hypothetical protein